MMKNPIFDFAAHYTDVGGVRMHMPGHKGRALLGCEAMDITEIDGADSLYEASGIIAESEKNAALLFGAHKTLYSTEGSSQCIRAMLALIRSHGERIRKNGYILAARNVHKTFVICAFKCLCYNGTMILFDSVTKKYPGDSAPALDSVSLHIEPNEFVFLVGKSGAGNRL